MDLLMLVAGLYAGIAIVAYTGTRLGLAWRERRERRRLRDIDWRYR